MRTELRLQLSIDASDGTDRAFPQLQFWISAYLRADVVFAHPEHLIVIDGIIP